MLTRITPEMSLEPILSSKRLNTFFQSLPIKPLAYLPSERTAHILLYNCHTLKPFKLSLASITYKDIFLHLDRIHFNLEDFKRHKIDPKDYLNWLCACCKRRSFLYSCRSDEYTGISPSLLCSFPAIADRRLLAEAYCLLIESWHYDSLVVPLLDDHVLYLIRRLSPDIRIDSHSIHLTEDLIHIFEKALRGYS